MLSHEQAEVIVSNFKNKGSAFELAEFFRKWQADRILAFFDERVGQNKNEIFTYDPGVTLSGADERSQPQQLPETQLDTQPEQ